MTSYVKRKLGAAAQPPERARNRKHPVGADVMEVVNGSLEIFAALVIIMLLASVYSEESTKTFEKYLTAMMLCQILVLTLDAARWFLHQRTDLKVLMIVLSVMPTLISLLANGIFAYFTIAYLSQRAPIPRRIYVMPIILFALSIVAWAIFILYSGAQHFINIQTNHTALKYSFVYWIGHVLWGSACFFGTWIIFRCRKTLTLAKTLALSSYCIFPFIGLSLRFFWDGAQIFLSTSLSLVCIHAVMHHSQRQRLQERELQLAQKNIAILLSQIQPHFLYNALTAICCLCDTAPKEAKQITAEFADYLRHNLNSLKQRAPIPFADELQHTKVYLSIEEKRFGERLSIAYDIHSTTFQLPSLTLQPIVENAVKHGVMPKKKGGTISLSTHERDACHEIIVTDDGVGFDPDEVLEDQHTHIGINNVRNRLWCMCRGTLTIQSKAGNGTTAIITIPKDKLK